MSNLRLKDNRIFGQFFKANFQPNLIDNISGTVSNRRLKFAAFTNRLEYISLQ